MGYFIAWIIFGILAMMIATSKGDKGGKWFFIGLLLGPLALLFALLMTGTACPFCKSKIHKEAVVCPKCGKTIKSDKMDETAK